MTLYELLKQSNKDDMAKYLAALVAGAMGVKDPVTNRSIHRFLLEQMDKKLE